MRGFLHGLMVVFQNRKKNKHGVPTKHPRQNNLTAKKPAEKMAPDKVAQRQNKILLQIPMYNGIKYTFGVFVIYYYNL